MGCDYTSFFTSYSLSSFNPRTRMGCDWLRRSLLPRTFQVSIHAPAWGATHCIFISPCIILVSIHAPAWGATWGYGHEIRPLSLFQSTHPHGVRPKGSSFVFVKDKFQSTHPHGVRHYPLKNPSITKSFQSTHPHGVRPDFLTKKA